MLRKGLVAFCMAGFSGPGLAETFPSVSLNFGNIDSVVNVEYLCDDLKTLYVRYIRVGDDDIVLVPVNGRDRIFVNVVAGSGARYVSGQYEWWAKGNEVSFTDFLEEESEQQCVEQGDPPQN